MKTECGTTMPWLHRCWIHEHRSTGKGLMEIPLNSWNWCGKNSTWNTIISLKMESKLEWFLHYLIKLHFLNFHIVLEWLWCDGHLHVIKQHFATKDDRALEGGAYALCLPMAVLCWFCVVFVWVGREQLVGWTRQKVVQDWRPSCWSGLGGWTGSLGFSTLWNLESSSTDHWEKERDRCGGSTTCGIEWLPGKGTKGEWSLQRYAGGWVMGQQRKRNCLKGHL